MDDLYPWPQEMPDGLWPIVVALLRGQEPEGGWIEVLHVGWHAAGFLAGKYDPNHSSFDAAQPLTATSAADLIESRFVLKTKAESEAFPWMAIAAIVWEVVQAWLRRPR